MKQICVLAAALLSVYGNSVVRDASDFDSTNINVNAGLGANGPGWAGSNHADSVQGASSALDEAAGISLLEESGTIVQLTGIDSDSAEAAQSVTVDNFALATEGATIQASGLSVSVEHNGWSGAVGQGLSSADGIVNVAVNPLKSLKCH